MNKRKGMELIGIGCVSILLAGTGFFFFAAKTECGSGGGI